MDLDLKGKLMEHEWRPICRNANRLRHQNATLIMKRKDHFLTVVSRLSKSTRIESEPLIFT